MELNNITNTGTWGEQVTRLNDNFNKVAIGIDTLQSIYESLSQSDIEVVNELPQTGEANKIYRLVGTTSYTDYMYNADDLTTPIPMATYDNAIDDEPTAGSNNLVKSGGVASELQRIDTLLSQRVLDLPEYTYAINADGKYGANTSYKHVAIPVVEGEKYMLIQDVSLMRYALAQDHVYSASAAINLVSGTSVVVWNANETNSAIITIPSTCTYLLLFLPGNGYIYKYDDKLNILEREVNDISFVQMTSIQTLPYALVNNGKFGNSTTYNHACVSVVAGEKYLIKKASGGILIYGFATNSSYSKGGNIPLVAGTSVTEIDTGKSTEFVITIPEGCNYLLYFLPSVVTLYKWIVPNIHRLQSVDTQPKYGSDSFVDSNGVFNAVNIGTDIESIIPSWQTNDSNVWGISNVNGHNVTLTNISSTSNTYVGLNISSIENGTRVHLRFNNGGQFNTSSIGTFDALAYQTYIYLKNEEDKVVYPDNKGYIDIIFIKSSDWLVLPSTAFSAGQVLTISDFLIEKVVGVKNLQGNLTFSSGIIPPNYTYEQYMNISDIRQGSCVWGNYFFGSGAANEQGELTIKVYDLQEKSLVDTLTLADVATNTHANTITFGNEKYDSGDTFPCLYIPTGYADGNGVSYVYVCRITGEMGSLSISIIQTISLDFNGEWTEWISGDGNRAWVQTGDNKAKRFRCYLIPALTDSEVTIDSLTPMLEDFTLPPQKFGYQVKKSDNQGFMYNKGRIWLVSGVPSRDGDECTYLSTINLRNQCRESVVWLKDVGLTDGSSNTYEPEGIFIWNDQLYVAFPSFIAKIIRVDENLVTLDYDISDAHSGATYANLAAALGTNGANVPSAVRKGGMSIKFINSTTNKYEQWRYMLSSTTNADFSNVSNWNEVSGEGLVENPEWIKVVVDKDGRVLAGIKSDGSVDWAKGVPQCVKDEITASLASKVDKVEGKGLSTNDYSDADKSMVEINSIKNDEDYIKLLVDKDGRVLEKIYKDGSRYIHNVKSETLDRIEEKVSSMGGLASECSDNNALLLRKHIEDNWSYWTDVDISDPQSYDVESYIDERIRSVDAKANKVMFVTDSHWNIYGNRYGAMVSNDIMSYVKERLNVPKVLFGGDAIGEDTNRYKAMAVLKKYYNSALSAFGKDFIPVIGDHDNNTFPNMGEEYEDFKRANYIDFKDTLKVILEQIQNYAVFDDEMIGKVDTLFSSETVEMRNEIKQMLRCHYYVDDVENKVRYLILYSGAPHPLYLMDDFFKIVATQSLMLFAQFDFIAKSLLSVPEGYSVIVATHKVAETTLTEDGVSFRGMRTHEQSAEMGTVIAYNIDLCAMLSAFKTKSRVTINNSRSNTFKNINKFFRVGDHTYDFTNAPSVKKIIGLSGHVHLDNSYLAGTVDGVYKSFYYQVNVPLPEDAILWIGFNTENRNRCHTNEEVVNSGPNASGATMTSGTVNETSFDVVTWDEQQVICTRFGGGVQQRVFNY